MNPASALLVVVSSLAATAGFAGVFSGLGFASTAVIGASAPVAAAAIAVRRRLLPGESLALSAALFVTLGPLVTHGPGEWLSIGSFVDGLIHGWADVVTSPAPADLTPSLAAVPYTIAWFSSALGVELARRRHPVAALAGPVAGLTLAAPLTVEDRNLAVAQGAVLAGCLLLGCRLAPIDPRNPDAGPAPAGHRSARAWARSIGVAATLGIVLTASVLLAPRNPFFDPEDRKDLRQQDRRPWDPLSTPGPLVDFKASLKEGRSDDLVFVVESDRAIRRWSLAVLDTYDGVVWAVADDTATGGRSHLARFQPVDTVVAAPPVDIAIDDPADYRLEITDLDQPWVPVAGWPAEIRTTTDLRLHPLTGTLAAPDGVGPGDAFAMTAYLRPELDRAALGRATVSAAAPDRPLDLVPPGLRNLAGDLFEGETTGMGRVLAVADHFVQRGFYDHGPTVRPGHSLARLEEFLADPDRLVGYGEHYAAAAGALLHVGDLPGRVVVGYLVPDGRHVDGRTEVFADDLTAWLEVRTVEHGWIPLTVTPDRSREPRAEDLGVTTRHVAAPNPPPPPPPPPDATPPAQPEDADRDQGADDGPGPDAGPAVPRLVAVGATGVGVPVAVAAVPAGIVVGVKRRRSTLRRSGSPAERIDGAWHEVTDRFRDAGWPIDSAVTPTETVTMLTRSRIGPRPETTSLVALAAVVDRATFHPQPPDGDQADAAWLHCDRAVAQLHGAHGRWQRLCMRTDPRTLRGPTTRPRNRLR